MNDELFVNVNMFKKYDFSNYKISNYEIEDIINHNGI